MWDELGITLAQAAAVVITTVGIAVVLLILLKLLGQRTLTRMTTFDVAVLLVIGSAGGRVVTGYTPTLTAGIVALVTLAALSWLAGQVSRTRLGAALLHDRPILLVDGQTVLQGNLRRARLSEGQLWGALRSGGVRNLSEVAAVVLEGDGSISVVRTGATVDPRLLTGLRGGDRDARHA